MTENGAVAPVPELLSSGSYALYRTPEGGMHIAYRAEGAEEDGHLELPAQLVPALEGLMANPGALAAIANSPMGKVAERMARNMASKMAAGS